MTSESLIWRGEFTNSEVNKLHAEAFRHPVLSIDWVEQVRAHSLGWVTAREGGKLVGFMNVAWDGGVHAFVLDTMVAKTNRRLGIGARLVGVAEAEARAAGCEWLHVDFDDELRSFYFDACGFRTTPAGVIALPKRGDVPSWSRTPRA
jgi:GNAT superfamily N-acetyltransferase